MAKITHQEVHPRYAVFVEGDKSNFRLATYFVNDHGEGILENERSILKTQSFSVAFEVLSILRERIILENRDQSKERFQFINPELFSYHQQEWIDFRLTGVYPPSMVDFVEDFYAWSTRMKIGFSFITRSEWEKILEQNDVVPTIISNRNHRRYILSLEDCYYTATVPIDAKAVPIKFLKVSYGDKTIITRRSQPSLFEGLPFSCDEISFIPLKEEMGFTIQVSCYSAMSGLIKRFKYNDQASGMSHLDALQALKTKWDLCT